MERQKNDQYLSEKLKEINGENGAGTQLFFAMRTIKAPATKLCFIVLIPTFIGELFYF